MPNKKQKGFTLIEMLVVVLIIGILATIVVVSVSGGRKKALAVQSKAAAMEFSKGMEMAAAEGCRKVNFTAGVLTCAATSKQYATLPIAPVGIKYTLVVGTQTSTSDSTGGAAGTWATNITNGIINTGYYLTVTGYSSGTFECSDGTLASHTRPGCACSVDEACTDVQ